MIRHIVFFKVADEETKEELVLNLNSLRHKIDFIQYIEVGVNFTKSERAFDVSLTVDLENEADLKAYATHKDHLPIVNFIKENNIEAKVVDYIKEEL